METTNLSKIRRDKMLKTLSEIDGLSIIVHKIVP